MSEAQATLLMDEIKPSFVVILADGDDAGTRMATSALALLSKYVWTRWEALTNNEQPTDVSAEALHAKLDRLMGK
jgi:hypothetical protein